MSWAALKLMKQVNNYFPLDWTTPGHVPNTLWGMLLWSRWMSVRRFIRLRIQTVYIVRTSVRTDRRAAVCGSLWVTECTGDTHMGIFLRGTLKGNPKLPQMAGGTRTNAFKQQASHARLKRLAHLFTNTRVTQKVQVWAPHPLFSKVQLNYKDFFH